MVEGSVKMTIFPPKQCIPVGIGPEQAPQGGDLGKWIQVNVQAVIDLAFDFDPEGNGVGGADFAFALKIASGLHLKFFDSIDFDFSSTVSARVLVCFTHCSSIHFSCLDPPSLVFSLAYWPSL